MRASLRVSVLSLRTALALAAVGLVWVGGILSSPPAHAATGINQTINYQGRLLNAAGAVIPDGNYNMEFKIYQDGPGNVANDTGGTLKWTEDWLGVNSQAITVKNGYFSIPLGSINAFASQIDWNQDTLWLSQTVVSGANATSTSCTTFALCNTGSEAEMLPMKRLGSSVYALNSGQLGGLTSSQFVQLAQGIQTDGSTSNSSVAINKTGGTANILQLQRGGTDVMSIDNNGAVLHRPISDSPTAFQIQTAGNGALLTADTASKVLKVGSSTTGGDLVIGPGGTHLFSDGFETGTLSQWHSNSGPTVDTAQARTGKYAAKIVTSASQQSAYWPTDNDTGYATLYTRGYFYATAQPSADTVLFYLSDGGTHQVQIIRKATTGIIAIKYDTGAVTSNAGSTVFALNGWHKLELETKVSTGGVGVYKVWYDGTQLFNVTNATAGVTTNLTELQLGGDANSTQTFWADDVVVDIGSRPTVTDSSGLVVTDSISAGGTLSVAGPTALTGMTTINNQLFIGQNTAGGSAGLADISMTQSASLYWGGFYTGTLDHWRTNSVAGDIGVVVGIQNGGLSYKLATAGSNPADTTLTTKQVLNVKPAQVELGQAGASGQTGVLVFNNTGTTNTFTLQGGGSGSAAQTWNMPTATATAAGQCITSSTSGATQNLTWAGCANTALSNLASVAINAPLNFVSTGAGSIGFNAAATAAGNSLTIAGQTAGGSGNAGGGVTLQGGTGTTTGAAGDLTLLGGSSPSGATGSVIVKSNTANSTNAFQIQNAAGTNLLNVSTLTTGGNLVTNPSFENSSGGWIAKGNATIGQTSEVAAQFGLKSLKITTTAAANDGATYTFPFTASGTYSLTFWAKASASTGANIAFGHRENTTSGDVNCLSAQTLTTTWTQFTCTAFTANATVNDAAPTMGIYIKQTNATARTLYIDGVTLVNASTALNYTLPGSELSVEGYYNNLSVNANNNGEIQPWKLNPTNVSANRSTAGYTYYNGYMYLTGGGTGADGVSTVNTVLYAKVNADGSVGSWTTNANNLATGVSQTGATVAGGYIYVAGGQTTGGTSSTATATVQYAKLNADGSTGAWRTTSSMVNAVGDPTVFSYNGYVYAVGGLDTSGTGQGYTQVAKINTDGSLGAWLNNTPAADIGSTGIGNGYAIAGGYVYKIGWGGASGQVNYGKFNTDGTISWNGAVALPGSTTINDMGIASMNGYLYILGGFIGSPTFDASTAVYYTPINDDGSIGNWITSAASLPSKREYMATQAINGYLYAIGGDNNTAGANTVYYTSGARTKISGALDLVGGSGRDLSEGGGGGQLTAGDTTVVGLLRVQSAAEFARSVSISDNLTVGSINVTSGDIVLAKRPDSGGATSNWAVTDATAGTLCGQASVDAVKSSAVFNGSLYVGTNEANAAEVCRYDGGTTWTRVNSAAGTFGAQTLRDTVSAMTVFNGYLYIGTTESNGAAVYRYDGGTTWTIVNSAPGTFNTTTNVDGVATMTVFQGYLTIGTSEAGAAQVLRYNSSTVWGQMNATAGAFAGSTAMDSVSAMAGFGNDLYIGTSKTNGASVYVYSGGLTSTLAWSQIGSSGSLNNDTGTDVINAMVVYGGALYVALSETGTGNVARLDRYNVNGGSNNPYFEEQNSVAGTFGAQTNVNAISSMAVYGDNLYFATSEPNASSVYRFDSVTFTLTNSTPGTYQTTTNIDAVGTMTAFNGLLYMGTSETNVAEMYTYSRVEGQSRALVFNATSDNAGATEQSAFPNMGSIYFSAENSGPNNLQAATGSFIFSHSIITSTGAYDVAEDYPTRDDSLSPGDLVAIDPSERGFVRKASGPYDPGIVGIYSARPALHLSQTDISIGGGKAIPVALAGRVPLKVDNSGGPILPGDPLTSSATPGVAMKATGSGRIVGMAMDSYDQPTVGTITTFVNPNYYSDTAGLQGATQVSNLLVEGTLAASSLAVSGSATVKTLNVAENATITTLNVSGTATIANLVATQSITTSALEVTSGAKIANVVITSNLELGGGVTKEFIAGTDLKSGQVVITASDGKVITTSTAGDTKVIGIVLANAAAGRPVKIIIGGTATVQIEGSAAPGDLLASSSSPGKAAKLDPPQTGAMLGKVLASPDPAGHVQILVSLH